MGLYIDNKIFHHEFNCIIYIVILVLYIKIVIRVNSTHVYKASKTS